jgi:hypothetical protein
MNTRKLAVVPSAPSAKPDRDYAAFDRWVRLAATITSYVGDVVVALRAQDDDNPGLADLQRAELLLARCTRYDLKRDVLNFFDGLYYYDGAHLYETIDGESWLSRQVVTKQIGLLVAGLSGGTEIQTALLIEELLSAGPSGPVLESACRTVRRTMTYTPKPAQMLKIMQDEASVWGARLTAIADDEREYHDAVNALTWYDDLTAWILELKVRLEQQR